METTFKELVIKIPDDFINKIKSVENDTDLLKHELLSFYRTVSSAVLNGTSLPKGHGELKDVNEIWKLYDYSDMDYTMIDALEDAPTIIEADKGQKDD